VPERDDTQPRRPRPLWSGTVAFGLVTLPVSLYPAVRSSRASLRMVDEEGTPLARRYFAEADERPLESDEIVRGYPIDGGFVVVEDEELASLAPEKSQEIDLSRFVDASEIDPTSFERGYFLAPDRGALKAYRLLARSMEDAGRAGIATFVMRDTEYLVAILAEDGVLRAETLRFHDELRTPDDVGLPELGEADAGAVREIAKEMKRLTSKELDRSLLRDDASRRLEELVESKREAGDDVVDLPEGASEGAAEEGRDEVDLMEVLKASLEQDEDDVATPRRAPSRPKRDARDPSGATKAELYERARELGIEGRSTMTKQQLSDAIRRA
jgi:DNA end-binding protein Ku